MTARSQARSGPTGLPAWLVQRASAVYMLLFLVLLLGFFWLYPLHSYADWKGWVARPAITLALALFFAALLAQEPVVLRPLPSFPIVRDLIVDMSNFFQQYHSIKPYLVNDQPPPDKERLQSPADREKLNGAYECILCACCSSQCPSFWWNPDKFVGPAGLIQAYRFIFDSRDTATNERLQDLDGAYRLFRCRTIMNCSEVCPKGLEPSHAIEMIRLNMLKDPGDSGALPTHPVSPARK